MIINFYFYSVTYKSFLICSVFNTCFFLVNREMNKSISYFLDGYFLRNIDITSTKSMHNSNFN